ncbi:hypothetical protein GF324_01710 [bacterium]|nr:hypothetical protein [bacterium]
MQNPAPTSLHVPKRFLLFALGMILGGCSLFAPHPPEVIRIHLQRYPKMQAEDAYKLLYHRHMGPAHAVQGPDHALRRLHDEVQRAVNLSHTDPLIERLDGDTQPLQHPEEYDGNFVRVHLGPFINRGGDLQDLARAFVESGRVPADTAGFLDEWSQLKQAAQWRDLGEIRYDALDSLEAQLRPVGWPAVHQSETFRQNYNPHYRVLTVKEALTLVDHLPQHDIN